MPPSHAVDIDLPGRRKEWAGWRCLTSPIPFRRPATVAGAVVLALMSLGLAAGCTDRRPAAGRFRPVQPGTLTVATSEIPATGFWEGTPSQPTGGFEWGLANALADRFGLARVHVVTVPFSKLVDGDLGGADLALSELTASSARERVLSFSVPYLPATPAVLVRNGREVPDLAAARKLSWSVRASSTLEKFLADVVRPDPPTRAVGTRDDSLRELESGRVDAILLDLPVAVALAEASDGQLTVASQFDTDDNLSAALPKGSANRQAVDSALRAFEADGTISNLVHDSLGQGVVGSSAPRVIRTRE